MNCRRKAHTIFGLVLALSLFGEQLVSSVHARGLELVTAGQPRAVLVIDSRCYPLREDVTNRWGTEERTISNIASVVVDYFRKSTGATLPVMDLASAVQPTDAVLVFIG